MRMVTDERCPSNHPIKIPGSIMVIVDVEHCLDVDSAMVMVDVRYTGWSEHDYV
mgnify:CR=1 FL=1